MKYLKSLVAVVAVLCGLSASAQWTGNVGYRSMYELGCNIGTGAPSKTSFEIGTIQGYQVVPVYLFLGTGASFQALFNSDGAYCFPVFVDFRSNFSAGNCSPYLDCRVGYASVTGNSNRYSDGGFYLSPSFGIRFGVTNNVGICLLYSSPSPRDKRQSRMPSSA